MLLSYNKFCSCNIHQHEFMMRCMPLIIKIMFHKVNIQLKKHKTVM